MCCSAYYTCMSVRPRPQPELPAEQALAVWWMVATLCEDHRYTEPELHASPRPRPRPRPSPRPKPHSRYTEPELYAVISSMCAMLPDHGVMRKEMVRRGFLHPPEIVLNANQTTSTYYTVNPEGLLAWRSEWRSNGTP